MAKRILVIDDENDFRFSAQIALTKAGYRVTGAENGAEGLEIILNSRDSGALDLIVVDVQMPVMSGMELIYELKRREIDTPVLVICGFIDKTLLHELIRHRCTDILIKPFGPQDLAVRIESIFSRNERSLSGGSAQ